jgi:twinkle protein
MFDSDPQGRASARAFAEVIGSSARIAELPEHDAADMLKAGKTAELISAMWNAVPHRPSGIVEMKSLRTKAARRNQVGPLVALGNAHEAHVRYPQRRSVLSRRGHRHRQDGRVHADHRTSRARSQSAGRHLLARTVAAETATRIAGKRAKQRYHVPDAGWTQEDLKTWDELEATGKVFLYDSFGQNDWDIIEDRIRFMAQAEGVKDFFIDHLTALAAWKDDERKALEEIMSRIGGIVKELDITIYLISHLATPEGKPHEEGGRVMIRHLKGSRDIGFWCHYIFALERDQQAEDLGKRLTTTFRVLKDRYTGQATGQTFPLRTTR